MLDIRPFQPGDVDALELQHQQLAEFVTIADWRGMIREGARRGPAWTGWLDGRVIGVAGITLHWQGRAQAWCALAPGIPKPVWVGIHRAVATRLAQLRELGVVRLEAETMRGFLAGDRWLRMLGFEYEGTMRCYGPGGEDFGRYARVTA